VRRRRCGADLLLTLGTVSAMLGASSAATAQPLFFESWNRTAAETYVPDTVLFGDTGLWRLQDTASECGQSPNSAEVIVSDDNKSLTLTSVKTDSDCADNVWIEPASLAVRPIPFGSGLTFSFTETGQIIDPESCDAVYIAMLFDARIMEYALQRGAWWTNPPRGTSCTDNRFDFPGPVILLEEHDGTYCRDLRSDLLSVGLPLPQAVTDFVLEITSGGSATIDDIKFVDSASVPTCAPSPTPTPTPTATQTATATSKPTKTSGPGPFVCVGDCHEDGQVTVDEILMMVNIALGNTAVSACPAGDPNADDQVTIDEILTAVDNALNGCAGGAIP
jgi:hypothetical protein